MFTFNDVAEAQSSFKPTIDPGIHKVSIISYDVTSPEDKTKSPYCAVKYANIEGTREATIKFYMNDNVKEGKTKSALDISLGNAKHIANNCDLSPMDIAKIKGSNKEELLVSMIAACVGKPYRQKFVGEEFMNDKGDLRVKVGMGFPNFAESIKVADEQSQLIFKKTDSYDYKRLPMAPHMESDGPTFTKRDEPKADMPF